MSCQAQILHFQILLLKAHQQLESKSSSAKEPQVKCSEANATAELKMFTYFVGNPETTGEFVQRVNVTISCCFEGLHGLAVLAVGSGWRIGLNCSMKTMDE